MAAERTFCRICQAYCGLRVDIEGREVRSVRPDRDHPVSRGYTCTKGRALGELHASPQRLLVPRLLGREASWDDTLADLASTIEDVVATGGPDAVGFFRGTAAYFDSAGLAALGGLLREIGSRQLYTTSTIDQVARFWVAQLMCGHHDALPLVDAEQTSMTILAGTNPPASHGHITSWPDPLQRLRRLSDRGGVWCLDVRETETTAIADHHLAPRPGTDWAMLGHLVRQVLRRGGDQQFLAEHTIRSEELAAAVEPLDAARGAAISGVPVEELTVLDDAVRRAGRVAVQTGTGTTMSRHGDLTEWMAWALMAVTGSLDRPGGVWFNPGYFPTPGPVRSGLAAEPGPASRDLSGRFGERPTAALVDEIEAGTVKVLIVVGGNPLRAIPGTARLARAFGSLDALAVFDVVETSTVAAASHVLPCAAQLERSDVSVVQRMYPVRGVQYSPALLHPPGDSRVMFDAISELAERLGHQRLAPDSESLFTSMAGEDADALRERRVLTADPVYGWFTTEMLQPEGWNLAPAPLSEGLTRALGTTTARDGLVLTPRRQIGHMNTLLAGRSDRADLLIHPIDARDRGLLEGDTAVVRSHAGGEVTAVIRTDPTIRPGVVSLPHGYDEPNIADLTIDTDDVHPIYGMPVLSGLGVEVAASDRGGHRAGDAAVAGTGQQARPASKNQR